MSSKLEQFKYIGEAEEGFFSVSPDPGIGAVEVAETLEELGIKWMFRVPPTPENEEIKYDA